MMETSRFLLTRNRSGTPVRRDCGMRSSGQKVRFALYLGCRQRGHLAMSQNCHISARDLPHNSGRNPREEY